MRCGEVGKRPTPIVRWWNPGSQYFGGGVAVHAPCLPGRPCSSSDSRRLREEAYSRRFVVEAFTSVSRSAVLLKVRPLSPPRLPPSLNCTWVSVPPTDPEPPSSAAQTTVPSASVVRVPPLPSDEQSSDVIARFPVVVVAETVRFVVEALVAVERVGGEVEDGAEGAIDCVRERAADRGCRDRPAASATSGTAGDRTDGFVEVAGLRLHLRLEELLERQHARIHVRRIHALRAHLADALGLLDRLREAGEMLWGLRPASQSRRLGSALGG